MKVRLMAGAKAPDFVFDSPWEKSLRFYEAAGKGRSILFFLRYVGCPICQMKISEIIHDWELFKQKGCSVFVALQSEPELIKRQLYGEEMSFKIICDPGGKIFSLYGVKPGSIFGYITPSVIATAIRAGKQGFKHGKKEGAELQLPAVFIMDGDKKITYSYYGRNIADLPDNNYLIGLLK